MITDKSRYGHDAVLDLNCGDSVQVLRTEPMTLTEQEQKIVQKYLGIALLEKSYIDANGHLMVVLSDGRTLDVGSARGLSGATPYLGENGNWFVEGVDTLQSARGLPGFTPYIGENEHWWIDGTDTGIPARGIPLTEKADNTRFLRNDGTWQKVTPENIGAAKQSVVADHESRIEALEQRTATAPYYTDDSVTYVKDVPENALPFASVDMIGGMTRKCNQLWDEQWKTGSYDTTDGNFTNSSTFFASKNKIKVSPNTTYYMTCPVERRIVFYDIDQNYISGIEYTRNSVFTTPDGCYYMNFSLWSSYGAVYKRDIMLNSGSTALPYEPYFDGLRSAPVTEVESVLANLQKTVNGTHELKPGAYITFENGHFEVKLSSSTVIEVSSTLWRQYTGLKLRAGTYTVSISNFKSSKTIAFYLVNATKLENITIFRVVDFNSYAFTLDTETEIYIGAYMYFPDGVNETISGDIMLNRGTTALPYTPYRSDTLPIPAAVQALDGYGWSMSDKIYNYIDWEKKQFVKRVEKIVIDGTNCRVTGGDFNYSPPYGNLSVANAKPLQSPLSSRFKGELYNAARGVCEINASRTLTMFPSDTSILSVADFNAWFANNPTEFYYELAKPVITDISDLLPDDNLIGVEGGGTVTMVNEYGYDVPSEITYARLTWQ